MGLSDKCPRLPGNWAKPVHWAGGLVIPLVSSKESLAARFPVPATCHPSSECVPGRCRGRSVGVVQQLRGPELHFVVWEHLFPAGVVQQLAFQRGRAMLPAARPSVAASAIYRAVCTSSRLAYSLGDGSPYPRA